MALSATLRSAMRLAALAGSSVPTRYAVSLILGAIGCGALGAWWLRPPPPLDLQHAERQVFSGGGEDGVLERLFQVLRPRHSYLVDLGAGDGITGSSSRNLLVHHGWGGLLVEPGPSGERLAVSCAGLGRVRALRAQVDPGDVEFLLERQGAPRDPDLLIIGLKANDWYVWRAIQEFRPRVVEIQYNAAFLPPQRMVIEYDPFNRWDGALYFGASIQSLYELGERKGYELVYADSTGSNLFFVDAGEAERLGLQGRDVRSVYRRSPRLPLVDSKTFAYDQALAELSRSRAVTLESIRIPRGYAIDSSLAK
jgi:hypothetical protein